MSVGKLIAWAAGAGIVGLALVVCMIAWLSVTADGDGWDDDAGKGE